MRRKVGETAKLRPIIITSKSGKRGYISLLYGKGFTNASRWYVLSRVLWLFLWLATSLNVFPHTKNASTLSSLLFSLQALWGVIQVYCFITRTKNILSLSGVRNVAKSLVRKNGNAKLCGFGSQTSGIETCTFSCTILKITQTYLERLRDELAWAMFSQAITLGFQ